jgi:hypothetical protein
LRKALMGNGLAIRRRRHFAHDGCRRGAHGVTRPTTIGSQHVFSVLPPTSAFGMNPPAVGLCTVACLHLSSCVFHPSSFILHT